MTLLRQTRDQVGTITWAGDSTLSVDLENVGIITEIKFTAEITPSATLAGANQPDALNRIVQNLRIQGSSQPYITLPGNDAAHGGTILHELNKEDGHGIGHSTGSVTAPAGQAHIPMTFVIHPGSRPRDAFNRRNKFDLTGGIPAGIEGQLRVEWVTSSNDVMDDTVTVSSAVGRIGIERVTADSPSEILQEMMRQGVPNAAMNKLMTPLWSAKTVAIGGTTSDFAADTDSLPAGAYLKRITVLAQDATATRSVRSSEQITRIRLQDVRRGVPIAEWRTQALTAELGAADQVEADDAAIDFGSHAPQGIFIMDMRPYANPEYGLNLLSVGNTDFELGYIVATQAAGDDRLVLFERMLPAAVNFDNVRA